MNRKQRKAKDKQAKSKKPGFTRRQLTSAGRIAQQAYICRYMENGWVDLEEFYGFRGFIDPAKRVDYYNLALALPQRWQAVAIVYLRDNWGKLYRSFGLCKTSQRFKGIGEGITPLINAVADQLEAGLNQKHIYGRAVVFSPYSDSFDSLIPILRREKERLRLTDQDIESIEKEEAYETMQLKMPDPVSVEDEISHLLSIASNA